MRWRYQSPRTKVLGSSGFVGFLLGGMAAGKVMTWLGMIRPGVTLADRVMDHWPGFLMGAILGWIICTTLALLIYDKIHGASEE